MHTDGKQDDLLQPTAVFRHPENGMRFLVFRDPKADLYYLVGENGVSTRIDALYLETGTDPVVSALRAHLHEKLFMRVVIDDTDLFTRVTI